MINRLRVYLFSILILVGLTTATAWAETDCDAQLTTSSYSQAIEELAKGYIGLEQMKVTDAPRAGMSKTSRELSRRKSELIVILGPEQFTNAFDKVLKDLSATNSDEQNKKLKKRKEALDTENILQQWKVFKEIELSQRVYSVSYSPDGRYIVSADQNNEAIIWDAETGKEILKLVGHEEGVLSASFSHDGRYVVTASYDKTARIWDAETGKEIRKLEGHTKGVLSAEFSADSSYVVTASQDHTARIWDTQTGAKIVDLQGHTDIVRTAIFSRDGLKVATASNDLTARVWDTQTGTELLKLQPKANHYVKSADFTLDGQHILTGSHTQERSLTLWDAQTGTEMHTFGEGIIRSASFSLDGRYIIVASLDVSVWDIKTRREIQKFPSQVRRTDSAELSPDGRSAVTAGDKTIRIWKPSPPEDLD